MFALNDFYRPSQLTLRLVMPGGNPVRYRQQQGFTFPIYKALEKKYLNDFLFRGRLLIGRIWDFRKNDLYGDRIGDSDEGISQIKIYDNDVPIVFGNVERDSLVYCMSSDYDPQRFALDGYDAAFRIESPEFFFEIAQEINKIRLLRSTLVSPIAYVNEDSLMQFAMSRYQMLKANNIPLDNQAIFPAAFLKPSRFSEQNEIRAIFEEVNDPNVGLYRPIDDEYADGSFLGAFTKLRSTVRPMFIDAPNARDFITVI